eukprot:403366920
MTISLSPAIYASNLIVTFFEENVDKFEIENIHELTNLIGLGRLMNFYSAIPFMLRDQVVKRVNMFYREEEYKTQVDNLPFEIHCKLMGDLCHISFQILQCNKIQEILEKQIETNSQNFSYKPLIKLLDNITLSITGKEVYSKIYLISEKLLQREEYIQKMNASELVRVYSNFINASQSHQRPYEILEKLLVALQNNLENLNETDIILLRKCEDIRLFKINGQREFYTMMHNHVVESAKLNEENVSLDFIAQYIGASSFANISDLSSLLLEFKDEKLYKFISEETIANAKRMNYHSLSMAINNLKSKLQNDENQKRQNIDQIMSIERKIADNLAASNSKQPSLQAEFMCAIEQMEDAQKNYSKHLSQIFEVHNLYKKFMLKDQIHYLLKIILSKEDTSECTIKLADSLLNQGFSSENLKKNYFYHNLDIMIDFLRDYSCFKDLKSKYFEAIKQEIEQVDYKRWANTITRVNQVVTSYHPTFAINVLNLFLQHQDKHTELSYNHQLRLSQNILESIQTQSDKCVTERDQIESLINKFLEPKDFKGFTRVFQIGSFKQMKQFMVNDQIWFQQALYPHINGKEFHSNMEFLSNSMFNLDQLKNSISTSIEDYQLVDQINGFKALFRYQERNQNQINFTNKISSEDVKEVENQLIDKIDITIEKGQGESALAYITGLVDAVHELDQTQLQKLEQQIDKLFKNMPYSEAVFGISTIKKDYNKKLTKEPLLQILVIQFLKHYQDQLDKQSPQITTNLLESLLQANLDDTKLYDHYLEMILMKQEVFNLSELVKIVKVCSQYNYLPSSLIELTMQRLQSKLSKNAFKSVIMPLFLAGANLAQQNKEWFKYTLIGDGLLKRVENGKNMTQQLANVQDQIDQVQIIVAICKSNLDSKDSRYKDLVEELLNKLNLEGMSYTKDEIYNLEQVLQLPEYSTMNAALKLKLQIRELESNSIFNKQYFENESEQAQLLLKSEVLSLSQQLPGKKLFNFITQDKLIINDISKPTGDFQLHQRALYSQMSQEFKDLKRIVYPINLTVFQQLQNDSEKLKYIESCIERQDLLESVTFEQWQRTGCL